MQQLTAAPLLRLTAAPPLRFVQAWDNGTSSSSTRIFVEHDLQNTIALLARTPAALDALLRGLPEAWTMRNEGENTWTVFDVVAHLAYLERTDWIGRARRILEFGETRPFDSVNRVGFRQDSQGKSLGQLLDEFARVRSENLDTIRAMNLHGEDLARRGLHPALGPVTLSQLLATWAAHDLTHLHQLSRIMAHQYRDAVGPWSAYLGVMQCAWAQLFVASVE